jgi:hypothetical protein
LGHGYLDASMHLLTKPFPMETLRVAVFAKSSRVSNMKQTTARPIASLTISFGLVAIPVKLYSAIAASERISFHMLRKSDGSRVKEQFVAVNDGKIVDRTDMVKGYEFAKDKHVTFTSEELKVLEDATSPILQILQFVPLESVDPVYFLSTYYLLPDKGGGKPYALLAAALGQEAAVRGREMDFARPGARCHHSTDERRIGAASAAFQGGSSRAQGVRSRDEQGVRCGGEAGATAH